MITDEELVTLRTHVALLYGEDIAQDAVVRTLTKRYNPSARWYERAVWRAKRAWQREQITTELRRSVRNPEQIETGDETSLSDQIDARLRFKELLNDSRALRVIRHLNGEKVGINSSQRLEQLRRALREKYS